MSARYRLHFSHHSYSNQASAMTESSNSYTSWDFGLVAVFGIISLQIVIVSTHPLETEGRSLGIHQRQPSYLPTYNGIFSIHALNFTPAAFDKNENLLQLGNQDAAMTTLATNSSTEQLSSSNESLPPLSETDSNQFQNLLRQDTDDTKANEVDSNPEDNDSGPSTIPQIQVVTKTIVESLQLSSSTVKDTSKQNLFSPKMGTTSTLDPSTADVLKFVSFNNSETLLDGEVIDPVETDGGKEDIFDHLMKRIQSHWLEFVGKMKLSVLDVWKSISQHMMERLESFASAL